MEITTKARNAEINDDLELYANRKIEKLSKYNNRLQNATIVFEDGASKDNTRSRRVEVLVTVPGQTLISEDEGESFYIAIDGATDKMKRQLRKLKTKRIQKHRDVEKFSVAESEVAAADEHDIVLDDNHEETSSGKRIVVRTFPLKPISTNEAARMLESNGHSFLVFINEQGSANCLYKREDGHYGLLAPENTVD
ncbi:ribosome-associated translation inhibitor RaiA [bacterium]|nr:ribosome-associated translation inhibitor RaiA [bacterium]